MASAIASRIHPLPDSFKTKRLSQLSVNKTDSNHNKNQRNKNRRFYSNDSTTRTPWNSISKAGEDQDENRTTRRSTVKSLTNNNGGEWNSLLRTATSKRRLVTTAREWKNPNSRLSCGSSKSHGWSRESSFRRKMLLKSIVVSWNRVCDGEGKGWFKKME